MKNDHSSNSKPPELMIKKEEEEHNTFDFVEGAIAEPHKQRERKNEIEEPNTQKAQKRNPEEEPQLTSLNH